MIFVDTHAHICSEYEDRPSSEIIAEAQSENVKIIINVGTNVETSKQVIEVANNYDGVYAAIGIHPTDFTSEEEIKSLDLLLNSNKKIVAIGEIGLDYYHLNEGRAPSKDLQKWSLESQLNIAIKYNLPVLLHCRDAYEDLYKIISNPKYSKLTGLMHTYAGDNEHAKKFMDLGFYISFSGVVTFKNAKNIHEIAKSIPLEYILTETDTPFLTPMPYRGQKNHTKNVVFIAKKIAELRNESLEKVTKQIEINAKNLFRI